MSFLLKQRSKEGTVVNLAFNFPMARRLFIFSLFRICPKDIFKSKPATKDFRFAKCTKLFFGAMKTLWENDGKKIKKDQEKKKNKEKKTKSKKKEKTEKKKKGEKDKKKKKKKGRYFGNKPPIFFDLLLILLTFELFALTKIIQNSVSMIV